MQKPYIHTHSKWFAKDVPDVAKVLLTDIRQGIAPEQAAERLEEFGPNSLPTKKKQNRIIAFLRHFHDILIYMLFVAAFVTLALGHYADTVVIVLVAIVNAFIGFSQEFKAEKALEDIKSLLSLKASVIRGGTRMEVDSRELTLGDLVLLKPGNKIPADLRLVTADNLRIEESALTGESVPSEKGVEPLDPETTLGDRVNMAFSGTSVSAGSGSGIVTAVGQETELGRISQLLEETQNISTPLIRQMAQLGKTVALFILGVSLLIFLFGRFFRSYDAGELLLATIGLAIAAIPEGLPAILSIILAVGVQRMAQRKAIVRTLPSVETLGSVSVICSDKTGTLTKNEMTVKSLVLAEDQYEVEGTGYTPEGFIAQRGMAVEAAATPRLAEMLRCFAICNDSLLTQNAEGAWGIQGEPTEGALQTLFKKSGLPDVEKSRISTLPFDSHYKYMATLVEDGGQTLLLVKGAPDRLLDMSARQRSNMGDMPLDAAFWARAMAETAGKGQRLLGAAVKAMPAHATSITHKDVQEGLVFLGLAGIVDPPRQEALEAVRACKEAGITVKMITGDHVDTARAIGLELGIGDGSMAISGQKLDEMTDQQIQCAVKKCDIFARTSPEHKLKLVKALQANGAVSAMTGDGVNDAPALKAADVGIAMGIKGTEVTKDAAEIVLTDDNFSTIVAAVEEGRRVYDNLRKTILFILPTNGAESFLIIASILFGTTLPLTPVQILWVNMVTSVTVSLALAFEPKEDRIMRRPPRPAEEKILDAYFIWRIAFVSVLIGGMTLIMSISLTRMGYDEGVVRTMTVQSIVLCQLFHLFNSRSIRGSAFRMHPFSNRAVLVVSALLVVLQLSVTYIPFMNGVFGTVPLPLRYWPVPLLLGMAVFLVVEGEKTFMRTMDARRSKFGASADAGGKDPCDI